MRELRRAAHTVYSLHYHFVFTTKYRKPVLMGDIGHTLRSAPGNLSAHSTHRDQLVRRIVISQSTSS
jgi:REP element-mobilizing transposase RayT